MCDCMGLSCPSYSLAQEFPPPLIPQCLLQRACFSSSILGCCEEGCHTNQCLAFCRQKEHSWHSNRPKQLLCSFSGTGRGHCSRTEASQQEWRGQPSTLRGTAPWQFPAMASGARSSKSGYWPFCSSALPKLMGMFSCSWGVLSSQHQRTPSDKKAIAWAELWKANTKKQQAPANI